MIKLTEEMKEMLGKELPIIGTINLDGTPNIGPKRSCRVYDDETIVFNENTAGRTMKNIQENGYMVVIVVDRPELMGYRFVGTAKIYTDGKYYEEAVKWAEGKMGAPKAVTVMKIARIDTLKSGPDAGKVLQG
ncbi:pyridoxamine 5'-phosphate oxidase family protein [Oceanivirga salmonicida]|uniref:pyridoxamine 5'-phosphate oxidase family protein n=1 Tax=Oceanivirga salmonicida TaxID=1769291 RepID=UPI0008377807|nr:pyridoxamine 5'-phosphate oxidase family protein [Oceanivirga salmonicida]